MGADILHKGMTALQAPRISTTMASGKPRPPRTLPTLPPFCPKNVQNEAGLLGSPSARHPLEARRPQDAHNPFGQPWVDGGKLLPPYIRLQHRRSDGDRPNPTGFQKAQSCNDGAPAADDVIYEQEAPVLDQRHHARVEIETLDLLRAGNGRHRNRV